MAGLTGKAKLNIIIFGIWVVALGITVFIPPEWYGNYIFNNKVDVKGNWTQFMTGLPAVSYDATVSATTTGVFSVGNPIHLQVTISNANVTELTKYYQQIRFLDHEKFTDREMQLNASPDGGWFAKGDVSLFEAERVWTFLAPKPPPGKSLILYEDEANHIRSQEHLLELGPQSDTLALKFNSFAVKVAFIFGTFSILLLAPIFEGIFIREKKNESHSDQGNSDDKSKKPKN